jgi:hypothetical protein
LGQWEGLLGVSRGESRPKLRAKLIEQPLCRRLGRHAPLPRRRRRRRPPRRRRRRLGLGLGLGAARLGVAACRCGARLSCAVAVASEGVAWAPGGGRSGGEAGGEAGRAEAIGSDGAALVGSGQRRRQRQL